MEDKKKAFVEKWSTWFILDKQGKELKEAMERELDELLLDSMNDLPHIVEIKNQSKSSDIQKIADVMKLIEVKAKSYNDNKKEDRARKGVGVETEAMLRCRYCNSPLTEYLEVDIDYDEGITAKMPFCDDQCLDAYKDVNPDYFW